MNDGIFLIDKIKGHTSFDEVALIRKKFHIKKVGHSGTLDPFATGLMVIAINEGTKLLRFFEALSKTYEAVLVLGKETDTLDETGKIILEKEVPNLSEDIIEKVLKSFLGKSEQIPPKFSALKVNGKRLYEYARKNEEIEIKPREIFIEEIDLISYQNSEIKFKVKVSKGTYIRTLGKDIANKLNTCGYLSYLRRTESDIFNVKDAKTVDEISIDDLMPIDKAIPLPKVDVNEKEYLDVKNGKDMVFNVKYPQIAIFYKEKLIAIYEKIDENKYHCLRGLNR